MERIDNLLPDAGRAMSGSSVSRSPQALRLDDRICPHCGRELQAEWVEFLQPYRRSTTDRVSGITIPARPSAR